jgi:hypothetical protein
MAKVISDIYKIEARWKREEKKPYNYGRDVESQTREILGIGKQAFPVRKADFAV